MWRAAARARLGGGAMGNGGCWRPREGEASINFVNFSLLKGTGYTCLAAWWVIFIKFISSNNWWSTSCSIKKLEWN